MGKPIALNGKPYLFTELGDREFEELVYSIFKTDIKEGKYTGRFDDIDLLTGVAEQGRDCKLYYEGKVVGNIQCKNTEENITKSNALSELIKFSLHYILNNHIIPDKHNFTYFFVAAKGFSTPALDLIGAIKIRIEEETNFDDLLKKVLDKSAIFRKSGFTIDNTRNQVLSLLKSITITTLNSTDLNVMLNAYNHTIASNFFEIKKVIDKEAFREILAEYFISNQTTQKPMLSSQIDNAIEITRKILTNVKSILRSDYNDTQNGLSDHLQNLSTWCAEISFNDLKNSKLTEQVYVELDMYLLPRRLHIEVDEQVEKLSLYNIFQRKYRHFILLGQPGAGKTTSAKYLCYKLLYDANFYTDRFQIPIVVRLRELNTKITKRAKSEDPTYIQSIIFKHIFNILNLDIEFGSLLLGVEETDRRSELTEMIVIRFLDELNVLLILDGFDEITQPEHQDIALQEIRNLAHKLQYATVIITSRTGEFPYNIEGAKQFEICSLNQKQIIQFAQKWLEDPEKVSKFLKEITTSPFSDTMIKPLTLAHLCAIFERIGKIPDKPKTIYRKIVNLLIEEWDEQRSVKRVSKYANFETDRKFEFLCSLAHELSMNFRSSLFSEKDMFNVYNKIYANFDLIQQEAQIVVNELESHTGLFVQAGYRIYEFAHKSLQEYLTAEYIVKLPRIPHKTQHIKKIPNELAIAVTISSNPSSYFTELVLKSLYNCTLPQNFYESFVDRLIQEKPDFNTHSDEVVIALIVLYSLYIDESLVKQSGQMRMFFIDNLIDQFERFVDIVCKRNRRQVIKKYYREKQTMQTIDNVEVYLMTKTKNISGYTLPNLLYARPSFIQINNKSS